MFISRVTDEQAAEPTNQRTTQEHNAFADQSGSAAAYKTLEQTKRQQVTELLLMVQLTGMSVNIRIIMVV